MTRKRVVVLIDQSSRDAFSQLLVVKYLRWRGVDVVVANHGTFVALCEWHRPHVIFASWLVGGPLMNYLTASHRRSHLVLVDQEGGRLGERPFKRSFEQYGGSKRDMATRCARVLTWGAAQAGWVADMCDIDPSRIVVTGSPRFDPYLVPAPAGRQPHLGVTLRGDSVTSMPFGQMESLFRHADLTTRGSLSVGYPAAAQYEDHIWHVLASTRQMFRIISEVARQSPTRIVVRPGPWERQRMYAFLPRRVSSVTVDPNQSQPAYIRGAFAVIDESSSLSMEAYIAGKPTITTQALIPRLEEHIGGGDGALFNATFTQAYWRPKSIDEAVDLVLRAKQSALAPVPVPDALSAYLRDCHGWPRSRPSSFQMADALLELLDVPVGSRASDAPAGNTDGAVHPLKRTLYRRVPGASRIPGALLYARTVAGRDRELFRRYHYFPSLYPHGDEVSRTFAALLRLTAESQ
jgi:surface carbohydrate biosynthesis protein